MTMPDHPHTTNPQASHETIRRRIEALGARLSLPAVKRALGVLEGEHQSVRRGNGYEFLDIRPYTAGDEARLIDWKASARAGRPMIADKEQNATSRVWMLLDSGAQMTGTCAGGESQMEVALNALRMFAVLSLRRSDELSVVLGDSARITRIPLTGGYMAFDDLAERIAHIRLTRPRDLFSLLDYAKRIRDRHALIVIATAHTAWSEEAIEAAGVLAQTHPLIVVDIEAINPFSAAPDFGSVIDAASNRAIPAFMRVKELDDDVRVRREFISKLLEERLSRAGAAMLNAGSSEAMFTAFIRRISSALTRAGNVNLLKNTHTQIRQEEIPTL